MKRAARRRADVRWQESWWPLVVVVATGVLVFANTLAHGFVWDDTIILDQRVRYYHSALDAFLEPADVPGFPGVFRPLTFASFWLDQRWWWRNAFGFHLTSVLLHALNGALVYALARRIACSVAAALVGALLFAVHPIHTEAVAWVTGRVDVLATTWTLLAALVFLRVRDAGRAAQSAPTSPAHMLAWSLVVAACAFGAAASKEPGMLVPALLAAATTLPQPASATDEAPAAAPASRPSSGATRAARRRAARRDDAGSVAAAPGRSPRFAAWVAVAASAAGVAAYLILRHVNRGNEEGHLAPLGAQSITRLVLAFGFYVEWLLLPVGLRAYVPEVPGGVVVVGCAVVGVVAIALAARAPRARFAVLWIVLTLAPSMLVAIADISVTAVAERYLYLPSVGLALLAALAYDHTPSRTRRFAVPAVATVLAALALGTVLRNRIWHDEIALWSDVTRQEHGYGLPYMNLGLALADAGRLDDAEPAYRAALVAHASPTTTRDTWVNLGHLELRRGNLDAALAAFTHANAIAPHASAYYGIGGVYRTRARAALAAGDESAAREDFSRAEEALTAALRINPRHYNSQYLLGTVLYQTGDLPAALERFRLAAALAPDTAVGAQAAEAARELAASLAARATP